MTALPAQVTQATEFYDFLQEFRKRKTISWENYEERLLGLSDRLFSNAECENHFAAFDNSFAFLSPDIVHDIVERIETYDELRNLVDLKGSWGGEAQTQLHKVPVNTRFTKTVISEWHNKRQWENLKKKAPELSGKLQLENLCGWFDSGKRFYSQLRPLFTDIDISYHILGKPVPQEEMEPLRTFLVAQLHSPYLKSLKLRINGDLQLEEELLAFCTSERCESLTWDCHPFSVAFFVQVQNVFESTSTRKKVAGFIKYSAQTDLVDALKLKRKTPSSHFGITPLGFSEDQNILITTSPRCGWYSSRPTAVDVCIEFGKFPDFHESGEFADFDESEALSNNEHEGNDGPEEDDEEDYDDYWERDGCYCELEELSHDNWHKEDCEECGGCKFCKCTNCSVFDSPCRHCNRGW